MSIPKRLSRAAAAAALVTSVFALAGFSPAPLRPPQGDGQRGHDGHEEEHEEGPLAEAMYGLKGHLKDLVAALADPSQDAAALEHVTEMQRIALDAKLLAPANLADIPASERAAHQADFRREMVGLLKELAELELELLGGKRDAALKRAREGLLEIRERAHDKFQQDE